MFRRITTLFLALLLVMLPVPTREQIVNPGPTLSGNNSFTGTNTASQFNNILWMDGTTYPLTAAGLQSALNVTAANGGGTVIIGNMYNASGNQAISLGSTTITLPPSVCLVGMGDGALGNPGGGPALNYQGSSAAVLMPASSTTPANSCLRHLFIQLGGSSGAGARAIEIDGTASHTATQNIIEDIYIFSNSTNTGQRGLFLNSTGGQAFISGNSFRDIQCNFNAAQNCIDSASTGTGDEQNVFMNIRRVPGQANNNSVAFNMNSYEDEFLGMIDAALGTTNTGMQLNGTGNKIRIVCDNGSPCANETGSQPGQNVWNITYSSTASVGAVVTTSNVTVTPLAASNPSYIKLPSQTSAATNFGVALAAQTVIPSVLASASSTVSVVAIQTLAGIGCSVATNTATPTVSWTAPGGTAESQAVTALSISGNGALDTGASSSITAFSFVAKAGTAVTYTSASVLASTGCTTTPQYTVFAKGI